MLLFKFSDNVSNGFCGIQGHFFACTLSYLVRCFCDLGRRSLKTKVGIQNILQIVSSPYGDVFLVGIKIPPGVM